MRKGYGYVCRSLGSNALSQTKRETNDFYATDPAAAVALLKIENLSYKVWEPACGAGHLAKIFLENGHQVKATDLFDRNFGVPGIDFLKTCDKWDGDIVTNPPFKHAQAFLEHAIDLVPEGNKVCLLLRFQFLEGKARKEMFKKYPPKTVWVSSARINCGLNGVFSDKSNSMMGLAWFVWVKGYKGPTIINWF